MKPEIKARWLEALRSGKYKQAFGYLHLDPQREEDKDQAGFCCLGVLCELAVEDGVIEKQRWTNDGMIFEYGDPSADYPDWDTSVLPEAVQVWAGLDTNNPSVNIEYDPKYPDEGEWVPVSEPNDAKVSFAEIADMIERDV